MSSGALAVGSIECCLILLILMTSSQACNEKVCGPIVTKCQLLKKCNIDIPDDMTVDISKLGADCPGCMECASCLNDKYPDCCSCVGKSSISSILIYTPTRSIYTS